MNEIPTLTTPRLILRPFTAEDIKPLHQILVEEGVLRYFPNPEPPAQERVERLVAGQLKHWAEHNLGWWAVEPCVKSELIGWNGLQFLPETGEVEVGYLLSRAYWGQGLATEGARASIRYGFETLGLDQIVAIVHPENRASQRVIEKLGMSLVDRTHYFGMEVLRYRLDRSAPQDRQRF
jgi:RimJ/RimL family protein N-acetyltransferase